MQLHLGRLFVRQWKSFVYWNMVRHLSEKSFKYFIKQIYRIFVKTLSKCEILSPRAIYCITLLDYEIGLVKYVCHFTFVLRTITYRSSLKLNFHRLKRNCAHSRAKYLVYVFAIFTTLSADIP